MRRHALVHLAALAAFTACSSDSSIGPPVPGVPTQLSIATQPSSTAQSGTPVATQPVVRLRDTDGRLVALAGTVVTASVAGGGVTLASGAATTDGSGAAHFSGLTLTGVVGSYTLHFASGTLTAANAQSVLLSAGQAAKLAVAVQPSATATAGIALAQQPAIQLQDASGNAASQTGVSITAVVVSGAATLTNGTAPTNAGGRATFGALTLSGPVAPYTLRFSAPGLISVDAGAATALAAGTGSQLALTTQPSSAAASGSALAAQPVVQLRDAYGNAAAQSGVKVAATLINPLAGATLINDTAVSDATGKATFSGLRVSGPIGNYTLRFTASGYASAVAAAPTAIAAGTAAKIVLTVQPAFLATNATALGTQPVVQVQDSSGNSVPQAGIVVTASVLGGGPTITNVTATTDATGKASFSGLTLTGLSGSYQLQFATTALGSVIAPGTTFLQAGAPTQLSIVTQPAPFGSNDTPLPRQPIVRLLDVSGNSATQTGVSVNATLISGSATITGGTVVTNGSGVATFTTLTLTGLVGNFTFRFTATGLTSADATGPTTLVAGTPTQLLLTTQPSSAANSGVVLAAQPAAQLSDVSGNPVAQGGVVVTVSVVSGSVTITNGTATTNAAGIAVFSGLTLTGTPASYMLRFVATGLSSVNAAQPTVLSP